MNEKNPTRRRRWPRGRCGSCDFRTGHRQRGRSARASRHEKRDQGRSCAVERPSPRPRKWSRTPTPRRGRNWNAKRLIQRRKRRPRRRPNNQNQGRPPRERAVQRRRRSERREPPSKAIIMHACRGRTRLRFPDRKGQNAFFEVLCDEVLKIPGIIQVEGTPRYWQASS